MFLEVSDEVKHEELVLGCSASRNSMLTGAVCWPAQAFLAVWLH